MSFVKCFFMVMLLLLPCFALANETDVQSAKDEGMRLYNIHHSTAALPYLERAAEAGDVEAMYYMGEAERRQRMGSMTREALVWYLKAAEHGDPYAMLRLFQGGACVAGDECPEDAEGWREKALAETLPKAEAGDTDAMLALYHIYRLMDEGGEGVEWLEKAAEAGNPEAQTRLGMNIRGGQGWYFLESRRLEAAEEWFRKAAEQGYVPAMSDLAGVLEKQEKPEQAWEWTLRASENGHIEERFGVGWCYLNPEELNSAAGEDICQNQQDVVRGWAILLAMVQEASDNSAERAMNRNESRITTEEIEEAEVLAGEWIGKQPPLSDFIPRFGY
ncbi:tetratricopeptide repeat protein [Halomonas koreensis]|uniref:Tetratricopeptide repeat protein n=1 Tax=Halomonas koreensis TaxID=245385 RepID=A0ABU1G718_9GAMM|nr:tetratricopeptide repeat protein [Halomonas koreensis]MDR5868732.1 tetratricopeptide repeat protein [Halomonas koreensis]